MAYFSCKIGWAVSMRKTGSTTDAGNGITKAKRLAEIKNYSSQHPQSQGGANCVKLFANRIQDSKRR